VDVSVVSVEALNSLLLNEILKVESEDALLRLILKLGLGYRDLLRHIQIGLLSENGLSILEEDLGIPSESVWQCAVERIAHFGIYQASTAVLDEKIISDFQRIFADFQGKHFESLWRGSRDGFKAKEFHRRCDGHANTLTVVMDMGENIFGGFTPVKWESTVWNGKLNDEDNRWKTDDSLKSFLFTLKNPYNIPGKRFALKAEKKQWAIYCDSERGPTFGDFYVYDDCNANMSSGTWLGYIYTNDTGIDSNTLLTGSETFQAKEIEVFEITD
jgi:hypothetical protein